MKIKSVESINPFKSVILTFYDIMTKGYEGTIEFKSVEDEGSEFIIALHMKTN